MEYLLDTNIVGYILKGVASNKLKNKLMMINPDDVFISQITHAEIIYGLQKGGNIICLLYTSPSPRDRTRSRMPSSA